MAFPPPPPSGGTHLNYTDIQRAFSAARLGPTGGGKVDQVADEMHRNRMAKQGMSGSPTSLQLAFTRTSDPTWYWQQNGLPFDIRQPGELTKIRMLCRLLYLIHPTLGSIIDVYSTYPLVGMEMTCPKSKDLAVFYNQLFLDDLGFDEYLIDVGREYWTVGEAFPLGTFNELLGTWDSDELMIPEDVRVIKSPFLKEPRFEMHLPLYIRQIIASRQPRFEYEQLVQNYPELLAYANINELAFTTVESDNERDWIPVSNMVMSQVKHKGDSFGPRGTPLMMRAFRPIVQEEQLNSAMDAIAQRLYTPLLLAKLGASATDLGVSQPWLPTLGDLENFRDDMNAALAADFRLMVHHFAVNIENVFGRDSMPDLNSDFDRLEEKILQAFGMSKTLLNGAGQGETYAADAMNRDLLTQLLTTFQKRIKRFVRHRAAVVAEAQGHYDFEMKGGKAVPLYEEVVETDPENGHKRIVRQPKLLLPELRIRSMNLKDENDQHALLEELRAAGVPISQRTRLVNVPIDLDEEKEATKQEQIEQAVAAQETRRDTYIALHKQRLPIPKDLKEDFEPKVQQSGNPQDKAAATEVPIDTLGFTEPASTMALAPTPEDLGLGTGANATPDIDGDTGDDPMKARNKALQAKEPGSTTPPESHEQRANMPKASSLDDDGTVFDPTPADHDDDRFVRVATQRKIDGGEQVEWVELPEIGSFHTRHVGYRNPKIFFLAEEPTDAES